MKKIVFGMLIGILLTSTVAFGATTIKEAYFNDTLKISVNNAVADVEIVTVTKEGEQYGRNYVSVADYNKLLNDGAGLNLTTDFDQKNSTIVVQSKVGSTASTSTLSTGVKTMAEATTEKISQTPDGITQIDTWQGKQYISCTDISNKIRTKGYDLVPVGRIPITRNLVKGDTVLIENVPITTAYGQRYIEISYYIGTILPLIQ